MPRGVSLQMDLPVSIISVPDRRIRIYLKDIATTMTDSKTTSWPTTAWVFGHPARWLAFGLGSGLIRPAPGTWGTLAGWALWAWLAPAGWAAGGAVLLAGFLLGCWACHRTGVELGQPDHGGMVWDEFVGIWLVLWLLPGFFEVNWLAQVWAVVLFRFFDILKPYPIRVFDRRLKNGFGCMLDDVLAALFAVLVLALTAWLQPPGLLRGAFF